MRSLASASMIRVPGGQAAALLVIAAALVAIAAPPAAFAQGQDPACAVYGTDIPNATGAEQLPEECDPAAAATSESGLEEQVGTLPFSGLDLLILAAIAAVLTGTGFALHRLSSQKNRPRGPAA